MTDPLIETIRLTKEFSDVGRHGGHGVVAVDHVSLKVNEGEVFGIVGESGSGKSTLARCIFGITPKSGGVVRIFGETFEDQTRREERKLRSKLGFVFQDPVASLNPRMKIRDVIAEPLELHTSDRDFIDHRVQTLIDRVGLSSSHLDRRAHQLSGGQCQRVAIARALSTNPKAILLDEPTSSLDLSVQAQILNLLEDLRQEFSLTYILISHNLDVISHLSDRIAVMSAGRIVESGPTRAIMENPTHPFTKQLLHAHATSKISLSVENFDLDLWQDAPLNRWSFQHVDEFIDTEEVAPSQTPHQWDVETGTSPTDFGISFDAGSKPLNKVLDELYTDALVVVTKGKIVMEKYANGMQADSRHLLQSVSKSFLGVVIGQLVDEEILDPSKPIGHYLPIPENSGYFDASIQNVLDMAVALRFSEDYNDVNSEIQKMDRAVGWRHRRVGDHDGLHEFIRSIRKNGSHGLQFQYCSANTDVLAWLITEVTGLPYPQVLSERIWQPMGATHSASITVDDVGDSVASGGISATARDVALLGQLLLNGGEMGGVRLISKRWIEETTKGAAASIASVDYMQSLHPGGSYKNQWWITGSPKGELYGVGIYGQYLWVDPFHDTVIAKFSALPYATSSEHSRLHMSLFREIGEHFNK